MTPETRQHAPHRVGVEALLDDVGDARGEQPGQVERRPHVDPAQRASSSAACSDQVARGASSPASAGCGPAAARRAGRARRATRCQPLVRLGVGPGELGDLVAAAGRVVGQEQVADRRGGARSTDPAGRRVAVLGPGRRSRTRLGGEQADDVRQRGDREVRAERMLGDGRPADDRPALQDQHVDARPGPGRPRRPARCARPDHDHVRHVPHSAPGTGLGAGPAASGLTSAATKERSEEGP